MKKYLVLLLIPLFFACGKSKEEIRLEREVDSLKRITSQDSESINEYLRVFNEIQQNINEIKQKENIITTKTTGDNELEETDVEAINNDILAIYEMMQENKKKLSYLRRKLAKSNNKNSELKKTIALLNENIARKDVEMADLRAQLQQKNIDISGLNAKLDSLNKSYNELSLENESKDVIIESQDAQINTAYYIIDSKKNLKEKGILESDGGFIGIGSNTKVKLNESEFKQIDIREVTSFDLNDAKKVQLITDHPEGSYELLKNDKGRYSELSVTNPEEFWKMSKYLVISVK
ncbi:MAG: hypothetical protein GXO50_08250 [Chlorobi bacterium]|nr:hypothetical protein [Chlorobiota bacterium]